MAYGGYLIKVGSGNDAVVIPFDYIRADSYNATYQPIDVDSGESTSDGELYRTVLTRRKLKVEFNVPACDDVFMQKFLKLIRDRWVDEVACSIMVTAYIPSLGKYVTDKCYLTSDLNFNMRYADSGKIEYGETRIAFIGYATNSATYNGVVVRR